ncbi:MAG: hypothetical protein WBW40_07320, partial [Thermoplasmata archaeon]
GYTEAELAKVDLEDLDVAGFQKLVTRKLGSGGSKSRQRVIESTDLPSYLEQGWTVVTAVNGHQIVLNPPGSR